MFKSNSTLDVLNEYISKAGRKGLKTKIALAAKCQPSYFSQVLAGRAQLSNDQAYGVCEYFGWTELESDYFLTLVERERASNKKLAVFYERKLEKMRQSNLNLAHRINNPEQLEQYKELYYSAWFHSAIHILLSIPGFQSAESIIERLGLPRRTVLNSLRLLLEMGLIEKLEDERWAIVKYDIHIPNDSSLHVAHHVNWRIKATETIQQQDSANLHYTAIHSVSSKDLERIKEILIQSIDKTRGIVAPSKEETIAVISVDLFELGV